MEKAPLLALLISLLGSTVHPSYRFYVYISNLTRLFRIWILLLTQKNFFLNESLLLVISVFCQSWFNWGSYIVILHSHKQNQPLPFPQFFNISNCCTQVFPPYPNSVSVILFVDNVCQGFYEICFFSNTG